MGAPSTPERTLRTELEHLRLRQRAQRIRQVIDALTRRVADAEARGGRAPKPLALALRDFRAELRAVERRLRAIEQPGRLR